MPKHVLHATPLNPNSRVGVVRGAKVKRKRAPSRLPTRSGRTSVKTDRPNSLSVNNLLEGLIEGVMKLPIRGGRGLKLSDTLQRQPLRALSQNAGCFDTILYY